MLFKKTLIFIFILTTLQACLSVAKFTDFPSQLNEIDFLQKSIEYREKDEAFWTGNTSNEYFIDTKSTILEAELVEIIRFALTQNNYSIFSVDLTLNKILANRGMVANEWNSKTAVYYNINETKGIIQIYINTKITQDVTGGWSENRAKKVGDIIVRKINSKQLK